MRAQAAGDRDSARARGAAPVWLYDPWCFTPWYTAELARSLLDVEVQLRLVCPRYHFEPEFFARAGLGTEPGPFDTSWRLDGGNAHMRRALRLLEYSANLALLAGAMAARRPAVLHLQQCPMVEHGLASDLWLAGWARRLGVPVVHTVHNLRPHRTHPRSEALCRRLYATCDRLICHTDDVAGRLAEEFRVPAAKIDVIPHGALFPRQPALDGARSRARLDLPSGRTVFLWQGVLAPYKGLPVLLEAWRLVRERSARARDALLLIAGTGPEEERRALTARVQGLGLAGSVRLDLRYIPARELPLYYEAADVLLYPYERITTSGALLTGLNYEKPIIASDLPAFRAVLEHGENALLLDPPSAELFAEAMRSLLERPERMAALCAGARSNARRQTQWPEVAARTLKSYGRAGARL